MPQMSQKEIVDAISKALKAKDTNGPFFTLAFPNYDTATQCAAHLAETSGVKDVKIHTAKSHNKGYVAGGSVFNVHQSKIDLVQANYAKLSEVYSSALPAIQQTDKPSVEVREQKAEGINEQELIRIFEAALADAKQQGAFFVVNFSSRNLAEQTVNHLTKLHLLKEPPNVHKAKPPFQPNAGANDHIINIHMTRFTEIVEKYKELNSKGLGPTPFLGATSTD